MGEIPKTALLGEDLSVERNKPNISIIISSLWLWTWEQSVNPKSKIQNPKLNDPMLKQMLISSGN